GRLGFQSGGCTEVIAGHDGMVSRSLDIKKKRRLSIDQIIEKEHSELEWLQKGKKAKLTESDHLKIKNLSERSVRLRKISDDLKRLIDCLQRTEIINEDAQVEVKDLLSPNIRLSIAGKQVGVEHEIKAVSISIPAGGKGDYLKPLKTAG
ncbi:MAG: hypothetical protein HQK54_15325, partial [Oligoflexales bacterium]|nr:hypothetical protein [Oligoflexales bacterium]